MNVFAPVFRAAAMSAALTVSAAGVATAALAPPPVPSLVPAHLGSSVSYHYDAVETGARGTTTTRAVVTLTRVANDRVTVTVTPDEGPATAVVARLGRDGTLRADPAGARTSGGPGGEGTGGTGGGSDATDIPLDRPLGGLPGDSRGTSGSGYGGGFAAPVREARDAIPQSVRVLAALLASRPAAGANARSWPFAAAVESSESSSITMTARAGEARGTETTLIADGSGDVQIAAARDSGATQPRGSTGTGNGGGDQRGGAGGDQRGGTGGGQRGGGVPFPGGGQGGQGGGGQGGGVYGGGRGRRGGQNGGAPNAGSASQQRTVPATVNLHVESTFRGGRLVLARGSDASTTHATGGDVTTTVRWTLTAL